MREKMLAGDICNRIVVIAERGLSLVQAAQLMRERHVGCLVVVDETAAGRLVVGMFTDRDIVTAVVANELDPTELTVGDVMSRELISVLEDDSIKDMLVTMRRKGIRRLPVVKAHGVLIGLVTLDDLLAVMAEQLREIASVVETECLRERRERA
ncbi:CBS domain-containing protein [Hydrogenophaga sp. PBL-H3]|uniref:CBS domain-containing protein n=1 Tax=Hydrogenophaga sp. PBL-H3 TaxID=434010 RepID=UPI00132019AC|nr:CBS domain-containing protein [Hydrogenophaga sp. PBL-H3]QHE77361.1 CBS domain-containing protein [Hydrogenophaga sp. PBL-H3]QHE81785.1 CBS domain-containing protein [Hydrogenophaga sp. PBL-H3]